MDVIIGPEIVRSYKRLSYTAWHALAEFVDNSTQSYFDNQGDLDTAYSQEGKPLTVEIEYTRSGSGSLTIRDNAMGMCKPELAAALTIGQRPENRSGRSEFGLGLKTAACWFGNKWSVRTKRLGDDEGHTIEFDVEAVASRIMDLHYDTFDAEVGDHYTEITIKDLNQRIVGGAVSQVKQFLASMYRVDINEKRLLLTFNQDPLEWRSQVDLGNVHISQTGDKSYCRFGPIDINDKQMRGWVAVLERGSRQNAGFTILRRGRVIQGWPDSWRPQIIFGQYEGSNDLVNQRLVGEIHLDDFAVSHTKDAIMWDPRDFRVFEEKIVRIAKPYIDIALSYRKRGVTGSVPSRPVVRAAMDMLDEELQSAEFQAVVAANGHIPKDRYEAIASPMVTAAVASQPDGEYSLKSQTTLRLFLSYSSTERDPYVGVGSDLDDAVDIVINMNHPHVKDLSGRIGVLNHLKSCAYEGIAQWKVGENWGVEARSPALIRAIKDSLLRVGHLIDATEQQH